MLKKINTKKVFLFLFLTALFLLPVKIAWAQPDLGQEYAADTGLGDTDPREILTNLVNIGFTFLAIIAVIIIIYAGYLWMTSGGNSERIEKAKKVLLGAVIGLILILSSFAIVSFILNSVGDSIGGRDDGRDTYTPGRITPGGPTGPVYCDGNNLTPTCEAEHSICDKYEYCDSQAGCICQSKRDEGGSCNQSDEEGVCDPADFMCLSDLCGEDCTCISSPVIYSVSPVGGFCENDIDTPCREDNDCESGICNTDTPNGRAGNLVTISGHYFGTTSGEVNFNGTEALPPESENPACSQYNYWTDTQIIVVVPSGLSATNTIEVVRSDDLVDTTDNNVGPIIPAFVRNNIERPGLCGIDPDHGQIGDSVDYDGLNLAGSLAHFGDYIRSVEAYNSNFGDLAGTAVVSSIDTGTTTTFASSSRAYSNYLTFHKDEEPYSGPFITSFNPTHGPSGEYVTISGGGFGSNQGDSMVYFGTSSYEFREGNFDFPDVCGDSFWSENQIVVKVPEGASVSNRVIYIKIEGEGIISTAGGSVSPSTFRVETGEPGPGLCKIKPTMGAQETPLSFWGEYFGAATGSASFSPNINQVNINYWGTEKDADKVNTLVPGEAVSGPTGIKNVEGEPSNTMNFEVGLCTEAGTREEQNNACGPQVCCPLGTYKAGRCATSTDDCYIDIPNSVFEWEFNTGVGTSSGPLGDYGSCEERSQDTGTCSSTLMCPNTSGKCSFNESGIEMEGGECGDEYCNSSGVCVSSSYDCEYNESLNACLAINPDYLSCDLPNTSFTNVWGEGVIAYCNSSGHYYFDSDGSCPVGWSISPGGGCVDYNSSCSSCDSGFSCVDDGDGDAQGYCGSEEQVCLEGASCINNECVFSTNPLCECCCRIGNDQEDCCSFINPYTNQPESLTCAGVCGGDENADDDQGFGRCTGCRIEDSAGNVDQEASDEACVCGNNTGQFCDVDAGEDLNGDGDPDGICRDCSVFSNYPVSCSEHHQTCCVDGQAGYNRCRGGTGNSDMITNDNPDLAYCEYYQCDPESPLICAVDEPVAVSTSSKVWSSSTVCVEMCGGGSSGLGESCDSETATTSCDIGICSNPYSCITESGNTPNPDNDCGFCCCEPGSNDCEVAGLEGLNCQADKYPCTQEHRGLCCGCEEDSDCSSSGNPAEVGCGLDTCCRARPKVSATQPGENEEDVCANAQISASFNSPMSIGSFTGNIIVAGQYSGACPDGTTYLAKQEVKANDSLLADLLEKIKYKLKYFWSRLAGLFGGEVLAWDPSSSYNYCAVTGTVEGQNLANGNTKLTFSPQQAFDTDTIYFVIVKGDKSLNSRSGVLSKWGVGLNSSSYSPVSSDSVFNGTTYPNSYIWSFRTLPDQGTDGICEIDRVNVNPESYLFKTNENSLAEDDSDINDDSVSSNGYDRDKFFYAEARSNDDQVLAPIPGVYDWNWAWEIVNTQVVDFTAPDIPNPLFSPESNKQLVIAQKGIENDYTEVSAEVDLTVLPPANYGGDGVRGTSTVWVFLCNNPWPYFDSNGLWEPWTDTSFNCEIDPASCKSANYQFYYCRDSNQPEITTDDLPAISSNNINIGEKASITKESYFFREETPDVSGIDLQVYSLGSGGGVRLDWSAGSVVGDGVVGEYKIYYSLGPQKTYSNVITVDSSEDDYNITGLENGQEYCFAVTAVFTDGRESEYSQEKCITPEDQDPPDRPILRSIIPGDERVRISWEDNSGGEAVLFKIYYRATMENCSLLSIDNFGDSIDIPYQMEATSTLSGLTNGVRYCFGIVGVDEEENESTPDSAEAIPFASPSNLFVSDVGTSTVVLDWGYTDGSGGGVDELIVYYGTDSYDYDVSFSFAKDQDSIEISNLIPETNYFFNLKTYSSEGGGYTSNFVSEVSAITLP